MEMKYNILVRTLMFTVIQACENLFGLWSPQVYKQMVYPQKIVYSSDDAMGWLLDIASGMEFLHSSHGDKPMIIHRDLKVRTSWQNVRSLCVFCSCSAKPVLAERFVHSHKTYHSESLVTSFAGRLRV